MQLEEQDVLAGLILLVIELPRSLCTVEALRDLFREHFKGTPAESIDEVLFDEGVLTSSLSRNPDTAVVACENPDTAAAALRFANPEAVRIITERIAAAVVADDQDVVLRRGNLQLGSQRLLVEGVVTASGEKVAAMPASVEKAIAPVSPPPPPQSQPQPQPSTVMEVAPAANQGFSSVSSFNAPTTAVGSGEVDSATSAAAASKSAVSRSRSPPPPPFQQPSPSSSAPHDEENEGVASTAEKTSCPTEPVQQTSLPPVPSTTTADPTADEELEDPTMPPSEQTGFSGRSPPSLHPTTATPDTAPRSASTSIGRDAPAAAAQPFTPTRQEAKTVEQRGTRGDRDYGSPRNMRPAVTTVPPPAAPAPLAQPASSRTPRALRPPPPGACVVSFTLSCLYERLPNGPGGSKIPPHHRRPIPGQNIVITAYMVYEMLRGDLKPLRVAIRPTPPGLVAQGQGKRTETTYALVQFASFEEGKRSIRAFNGTLVELVCPRPQVRSCNAYKESRVLDLRNEKVQSEAKANGGRFQEDVVTVPDVPLVYFVSEARFHVRCRFSMETDAPFRCGDGVVDVDPHFVRRKLLVKDRRAGRWFDVAESITDKELGAPFARQWVDDRNAQPRSAQENAPPTPPQRAPPSVPSPAPAPQGISAVPGRGPTSATPAQGGGWPVSQSATRGTHVTPVAPALSAAKAPETQLQSTAARPSRSHDRRDKEKKARRDDSSDGSSDRSRSSEPSRRRKRHRRRRTSSRSSSSGSSRGSRSSAKSEVDSRREARRKRRGKRHRRARRESPSSGSTSPSDSASSASSSSGSSRGRGRRGHHSRRRHRRDSTRAVAVSGASQSHVEQQGRSAVPPARFVTPSSGPADQGPLLTQKILTALRQANTVALTNRPQGQGVEGQRGNAAPSPAHAGSDQARPLPPGWYSVFSQDYKQTYYVYRDPATGAECTTWARPT